MDHARTTARILWDLSRGHRIGFAVGLVALLGADLLGLFPPRALGLLVDSAQGEGTPYSPATVALFYVGAILAQALVRYPMKKGFSGSAARITGELRERFANRLLRVSTADLGKVPTGHLLSRATSDLAALETAFASGLLFFFDCIFFLLALPVAMILLSPRLCLYAVLPLPLVPFFAERMVRRISQATGQAQEVTSRLAEKVHENAAVPLTVRAYGLEAHEDEEFSRRSEQALAGNLELGRLEAGFSPGIQALLAVGAFIVLFMGGRWTAAGALSMGQFLTFLQYYGMLAWPLMGLSWAFLYFRKGEVSLRRIEEVLALPIVPLSLGEPLPERGGGLEVRDLTYRYPGAQIPALIDLSFSIRSGERVAILGASGSGKTTLVRLLARLIDPPPGTIYLESRDIRALKIADWRARMAVVPQEAFLFAGSLRENISAGTSEPTVTEGSLEAVWTSAGLVRDYLPEGLDTWVMRQGGTLSGGQRQRVALARALLRRAGLLVLDDALSALDALTEERILQELFLHSGDRTVILVTHRVHAARWADRILLLEEGRLVEEGAPGELLGKESRYEALARRTSLLDG